MDHRFEQRVSPYQVEQELKARYERPLEDLKAEIAWAEANNQHRFEVLMAVIDLDTAAYWESDWSHFERRGYEWAKPA